MPTVDNNTIDGADTQDGSNLFLKIHQMGLSGVAIVHREACGGAALLSSNVATVHIGNYTVRRLGNSLVILLTQS